MASVVGQPPRFLCWRGEKSQKLHRRVSKKTPSESDAIKYRSQSAGRVETMTIANPKQKRRSSASKDSGMGGSGGTNSPSYSVMFLV